MNFDGFGSYLSAAFQRALYMAPGTFATDNTSYIMAVSKREETYEHSPVDIDVGYEHAQDVKLGKGRKKDDMVLLPGSDVANLEDSGIISEAHRNVSVDSDPLMSMLSPSFKSSQTESSYGYDPGLQRKLFQRTDNPNHPLDVYANWESQKIDATGDSGSYTGPIVNSDGSPASAFNLGNESPSVRFTTKIGVLERVVLTLYTNPRICLLTSPHHQTIVVPDSLLDSSTW
jgi:hypothetical protein